MKLWIMLHLIFISSISACYAGAPMVILPPKPVEMDPELTNMPNPAVIAPNTYFNRNNHPAALDEGLIQGPSPAVIEPFPNSENSAVNNSNPVEENNPFPLNSDG